MPSSTLDLILARPETDGAQISWLEGARVPISIQRQGRKALVALIKQARTNGYHYTNTCDDWRYLHDQLQGYNFPRFLSEFELVSGLMTDEEREIIWALGYDLPERDFVLRKISSLIHIGRTIIPDASSED